MRQIRRFSTPKTGNIVEQLAGEKAKERGINIKYMNEKEAGGYRASDLGKSFHRLRRFYKSVGVEKLAEGPCEEDGEDCIKYGVVLDGKFVKTPKRKFLYAPSEEIASLIAMEWDAQEGEVNTYSMPMMSMATSTIDKLIHGRANIAEDLIAQQLNFISTDQATYRNSIHKELVKRQEQCYSPFIALFERDFKTKVELNYNIVAKEQLVMTVNKVHEWLSVASNWELAVIDQLTSSTKSMILSASALRKYAPIDEIFEASRVDERFQVEQNGLVKGDHDLYEVDYKKSVTTAYTMHSLLPENLQPARFWRFD